MRIIAGKFRGKKLFLPKDKNTRPLKDLVKESIFNLLEHSAQIKQKIKDASVLDLFSGSGSFGLECISRGSQDVYFFEKPMPFQLHAICFSSKKSVYIVTETFEKYQLL